MGILILSNKLLNNGLNILIAFKRMYVNPWMIDNCPFVCDYDEDT